MGNRNLKFNTDFAHGNFSSTLSFDGDRATALPEMLDNTHAIVSKQVYRSLLSLLNEMIEIQKPEPGRTNVEEIVKVELLDHTITLDIKLELNRELASPEKETLRFLVVNLIAPAVFQDAIQRFSGRSYIETVRDYAMQHAGDPGPFDAPSGGLSGLFGMLSGRGGPRGSTFDVGVMGGGSGYSLGVFRSRECGKLA